MKTIVEVKKLSKFERAVIFFSKNSLIYFKLFEIEIGLKVTKVKGVKI